MEGRYARGGRSQSKMTATAGKYPQGFFRPKPCRECKTEFQPEAPSHMYCGDRCAQRAFDRKRMEKVYGITLEEYEKMVAEHDGKCAICKGPGFELVKGQRLLLVIDHCHETGKVRGLLCHNCNRGIGLLQDNIEYLKSAVVYLEGATTIP